MSLSPGTRLGAYEILALLGAGGMGEVYRARDTRLKRDIAIKVLPDAWARDADRLTRLHREAELLATLNHPNIAAIYGFEEADGVEALLLELVEGPTLADRLMRGSMPLNEALSIACQIADAIDAAHERGIVHRDLKPANIKVREDGTVKVLDFGLAKALEPDASAQIDTALSTAMSPAMTRTGMILGTAAYMSPEQARGQTVDTRTDVWAFGSVLYEMLARRTAFGGETVMDSITAILHRDPDWSALPASTPASLRRLLRHCLQKDRKRRLRDIGDARHQLDEVAESDTESAMATAAATAPPHRTPMLAGIAALMVVVVVSIALWSRSGARTRPTVPSSNDGPQFSRITSDDSFSTEPAISRDGSLVVYASDRAGSGQLDLWLQRTAGGQAIRLTDDPADDREANFSPDGSLIAFRSDRRGGGVYVMPTLGGDARLVAEGGHAPRFSSDGTRIAYWSGNWLAGPRTDGRFVFIVPAIGGRPTRIADGFLTASLPLWSPDGRSLLFFGRKSADASPSALFDWWWTSLDGGEPVATGAYRLLTDRGLLGSVADRTANPPLDALPSAWPTTGVLFSARRGASVNLWRLGVSEGNGTLNEPSLERLTSGVGSDLLPSTAAADSIVFQVVTEGAVSLTLPLEPNTASVQGPIARRSYDAGDGENRNSLDHAGRRLAYVKIRQRESEIWLKDLMTGQERHVLTTPSFGINLSISPDGTKIAYDLPENGVSVGYIVPASGGTAMKVCEVCNLQGWFPDNQRILALDRAPDGPGGRVTVVDTADGTRSDLIVHPSARIGRVDVSRDGRWLGLSNPARIWMAPVRPGNPPPESDWVTVLIKPAGTAERVCGWSPDGRLLYLLLERDGFRDLYAQRIDPTRGKPAGEPFVVQHLHDPRRRWGSTPAGTAIVSNAFVFNQVEMTGSIWLLSRGADQGARSRP